MEFLFSGSVHRLVVCLWRAPPSSRRVPCHFSITNHLDHRILTTRSRALDRLSKWQSSPVSFLAQTFSFNTTSRSKNPQPIWAANGSVEWGGDQNLQKSTFQSRLCSSTAQWRTHHYWQRGFCRSCCQTIGPMSKRSGSLLSHWNATLASA